MNEAIGSGEHEVQAVAQNQGSSSRTQNHGTGLNLNSEEQNTEIGDRRLGDRKSTASSAHAL